MSEEQFQSTHPRGVRRRHAESLAPRYVISIHAPTWGATLADFLTSSSPFRFQSTHPRGVRRSTSTERNTLQDISIHAPTWGATRHAESLAPRYVISIHAPTWGATYRRAKTGRLYSVFQSTHPRGVRQPPQVDETLLFYFNPRTHVGCDSIACHRFQRACNFNPRTHVGCDLECFTPLHMVIRFQSTHPRGVRLHL